MTPDRMSGPSRRSRNASLRRSCARRSCASRSRRRWWPRSCSYAPLPAGRSSADGVPQVRGISPGGCGVDAGTECPQSARTAGARAGTVWPSNFFLSRPQINDAGSASLPQQSSVLHARLKRGSAQMRAPPQTVRKRGMDAHRQECASCAYRTIGSCRLTGRAAGLEPSRSGTHACGELQVGRIAAATRLTARLQSCQPTVSARKVLLHGYVICHRPARRSTPTPILTGQCARRASPAHRPARQAHHLRLGRRGVRGGLRRLLRRRRSGRIAVRSGARQ